MAEAHAQARFAQQNGAHPLFCPRTWGVHAGRWGLLQAPTAVPPPASWEAASPQGWAQHMPEVLGAIHNQSVLCNPISSPLCNIYSNKEQIHNLGLLATPWDKGQTENATTTAEKTT